MKRKRKQYEINMAFYISAIIRKKNKYDAMFNMMFDHSERSRFNFLVLILYIDVPNVTLTKGTTEINSRIPR